MSQRRYRRAARHWRIHDLGLADDAEIGKPPPMLLATVIRSRLDAGMFDGEELPVPGRSQLCTSSMISTMPC